MKRVLIVVGLCPCVTRTISSPGLFAFLSVGYDEGHYSVVIITAVNMQQPRLVPQMNCPRVAAKLACTALLFLAVRSTTYYVVKGLFLTCVRRKKSELTRCAKDGVKYTAMMALEAVVSLPFRPYSYPAAILAPRYLLSYVFPSLSDSISSVDQFNPIEYEMFSYLTFQTGEAEWDLSFFSWQVPSIIFTFSKLIYCRTREGSRTNALRVAGVLGVQIMTRAFLSSYAVLLPEDELNGASTITYLILNSMATRYLLWNTYPLIARQFK